ncbi:M50 family metallopeptidase [Mycetocola spongiae]|uniref:M50 family metallopeptidase n=1 Tax=Mycetocola spongiae TaxID=2859226 RepID=UPI001CF3CF79|nr:M50 family metallopeptidase [Mycetocola spongiae]UCR89345.1 M50 family metallopeptidase [Mycetocola spongiae]
MIDLPTLFGHTAPPMLSPTAIALILLAAIALSVPRVTWRWFGLFTTLVHELGHALSGALLGRRVRAIRLNGNHGGSATSSGGKFSAVVSGFLGYPAPALVGAGLIWSVFSGYTAAALVIGGVLMLASLLVIRGAVGVGVTLGSVAIAGALWAWAPVPVQAYALLILGIALLVGSVRALGNVLAVHTSRRAEVTSSDAHILYLQTHIPSPVWLLGFCAVIGWSVWIATHTALGAFGA